MLSEIEFIDNIKRNDSLMEEVFSFDPRTLETTASITISKYTIALAQYVIYLNSQVNKKRVALIQKRRFLDLQVDQSEVKAKTKALKKRIIIDADEALQVIEQHVNALEDELGLLNGTVDYFIELINAFKKELWRRDQEMQFNRYERAPH